MSDFVYSETLGRRIRGGPASELGVPTDRLVLEAVAAGRVEEGADILEYLIEEAGRIHWLFSTWLEGLLEYAAEHLPDPAASRAELERRIGVPPPVVEPATVGVREQAAARAAVAAGRRDDVAAALATLREAQMAVHDAQCDWAWGLLTVLREALGEGRMDDVFRTTQGAWLAERYATVGTMAPREIFELTIEGMRGHYCGSERSGEIRVDEHDDRWVMSFDPCGTGGRMRRGDPDRGQVPRTEAPFDFAHVEDAYDWTWNERDVCLYCAHCAVVNEILPIEQLGTPMRVTGYPDGPDQPCTWTVYKDPELVPDWAFERVGKRRPEASEGTERRS